MTVSPRRQIKKRCGYCGRRATVIPDSGFDLWCPTGVKRFSSTTICARCREDLKASVDSAIVRFRATARRRGSLRDVPAVSIDRKRLLGRLNAAWWGDYPDDVLRVVVTLIDGYKQPDRPGLTQADLEFRDLVEQEFRRVFATLPGDLLAATPSTAESLTAPASDAVAGSETSGTVSRGRGGPLPVIGWDKGLERIRRSMRGHTDPRRPRTPQEIDRDTGRPIVFCDGGRLVTRSASAISDAEMRCSRGLVPARHPRVTPADRALYDFVRFGYHERASERTAE